MKPRVAVLYLGTRGGGVELAKMLSVSASDWPDFNFTVVGLSSKNVALSEFRESQLKTVELTSESRLRSFFQVLRYFFKPQKLLSQLELTPGSYLLFPMVSPFDLPLAWILKRSGIKIVRIIHDARRHPGDIWPGRLTIRYLMNSADHIITMSAFAKKQMPQKYHQKITVVPHPVFDFKSEASEIREIGGKKYILFVGRIRKYKGVDLLLEAWKTVAWSDELNLVLAGSGTLPEKSPGRTILINRWLEDAEIGFLIRNAEIVVFPYREASQSGLLPFAIAQNKKVLVTPVGALIEQVDGYRNAFVSQSVSSREIANSLKKALETKETSSPKVERKDDWSVSIRNQLLMMNRRVGEE